MKAGRQQSSVDRGQADSDRRVRFTLDLAKPQHHFLKQFALDADADASAVMRLLLKLLEEDRVLAERVSARLADQDATGQR
jgi:hypothetical protein